MADWVLTHTNRFQCIVTHDGMVDPVSAYGTTEEMWFNEWEFRRPEDFPKGWDGFSASYNPMAGVKADSSAALRNDKQKSEVSQGGGHAAEPWRYQNLPANEDPFRKWSALRAIENAKTPTLIIHSQRTIGWMCRRGLSCTRRCSGGRACAVSLLPGRGTLGAEAAELAALVRDGGGLVRSVDEDGEVRGDGEVEEATAKTNTEILATPE